MKNSLIFFDINGTIVKRDKRTDMPYSEAVDEFLGISEGMKGVDTSARSDKDVFMEVLENCGKSFSEDLWRGFLRVYEKKLIKFRDTDVWRANADAVEFIKKLYKESCRLSLISGELSIGAEYKLKKIGVWDFFPTGGFGEDGLKRFDIADTAEKKAVDYYGEVPKKKFVIGDTVLDIKTARYLNARVVSITTGSHSRDKLKNENPDYIVDRFDELDTEIFR